MDGTPALGIDVRFGWHTPVLGIEIRVRRHIPAGDLDGTPSLGIEARGWLEHQDKHLVFALFLLHCLNETAVEKIHRLPFFNSLENVQCLSESNNEYADQEF